MHYSCQFPHCSYQTDTRSHIHFHHIVPKSAGGNDENYNIISLCPNHHHKIYIKGCEGIHGVKGVDSIILIKKLNSGTILQYIDSDGEEKFITLR